MNKILRALGLGQIGVVIPNLVLQGKPAPYPVVNERAVRAGAGIAFLLGVFAFFHAFYLQDFTYLKWLLPLLWFDFLAKVILGTKFAPLSLLGEWVVRKQTPDYVGAIQKRFAWSIGLALASVMVVTVFPFG